VLVAGICAFAVAKLTSGGSPAVAPGTLRSVPLDPKARLVAREFVATAVARKNLARAWTISGPALTSGISLAEWKTGSIPVQPYPVAKAAATYTVESSYADEAVLQVAFLPPPASSTPAGSFLLTLDRIHGRWLVSGWAPQAAIHPKR
jgi:hypothetical protein